MSLVDQFNAYPSKMNDRILGENHKVTNRFFSLDHQAYQDGAVDTRTKEMLGLIASYVLRCDDCIRYHLSNCHDLGVTSEEIFEIFSVGNIVGGSICVPHMRRAIEYWDELQKGS